MARKKKPRPPDSMDLPMTPMIDVVFQLLIYFLVTMKPMDVTTNLDVFRPAAEKTASQQDMPKLLRISVFPNGYTLNDKEVDLTTMDDFLAKLAALDKNQTVLIMVTALSTHDRLIKVLDLCAKWGLKSLSVISTN